METFLEPKPKDRRFCIKGTTDYGETVAAKSVGEARMLIAQSKNLPHLPAHIRVVPWVPPPPPAPKSIPAETPKEKPKKEKPTAAE